MSEPASKPDLLAAMLSARRELESCLDSLSRAQMTQAASSGRWSVKDIVAHINSYDRWLALGLALRLEKPPDLWIGDLPLDEFNQRLFVENRHLLLDSVLEESKDLWARILEETRAKSEDYLFSEQTVQGWPDPFKPYDILRSESYGHYLDHVPALKAWADGGG